MRREDGSTELGDDCSSGLSDGSRDGLNADVAFGDSTCVVDDAFSKRERVLELAIAAGERGARRAELIRRRHRGMSSVFFSSTKCIPSKARVAWSKSLGPVKNLKVSPSISNTMAHEGITTHLEANNNL